MFTMASHADGGNANGTIPKGPPDPSLGPETTAAKVTASRSNQNGSVQGSKGSFTTATTLMTDSGTLKQAKKHKISQKKPLLSDP